MARLASLPSEEFGEIPEPPRMAADLEKIKHSPLSHLTAQSARFGRWEVVIFNPKARTREYLWDGEKRTSYHFQCMLVSTADPTLYVLGDSHGRGMNEATLRTMTGRFKPGLVFHMSKIAFAENTNQQYNSTPKTEVISMLSTTWSPVLTSAAKPKMPEPRIPIVAVSYTHLRAHETKANLGFRVGGEKK